MWQLVDFLQEGDGSSEVKMNSKMYPPSRPLMKALSFNIFANQLDTWFRNGDLTLQLLVTFHCHPW